MNKSMSSKSQELVQVCSYRDQDAKELAQIYYHTIHKINSQDYSKEQLDVWAPKTSLQTEKWLKKFQITKPLVATVEEMIVGFAEFEENGHIDCFYCHHDWTGKGVGSALLKAIYEKATHYNCDKIFAEVSITAKPFFERNGFNLLYEQHVEKDGVKLTNFRMERKV